MRRINIALPDEPALRKDVANAAVRANSEGLSARGSCVQPEAVRAQFGVWLGQQPDGPPAWHRKAGVLACPVKGRPRPRIGALRKPAGENACLPLRVKRKLVNN
jgi:hypothetical protein